MDNNIFIFLFGTVGSITSILFFTLPALLIWDLYKGIEQTDRIPYLLFLLTQINTSLWIIYGLRLDLNQVAISNSYGYLTSTLFISGFLIHYFEYNRKSTFLVLIIELAYSIILFHFMAKFSTEFIGFVCIFITSAMYIAPSQKLLKVIETGDYTIIPLKITIVLIVCCVSWVIYGFLCNNTSIIIPCSIGNLFLIEGALMNIITTYIWYHYKKIKESNTESTINLL